MAKRIGIISLFVMFALLFLAVIGIGIYNTVNVAIPGIKSDAALIKTQLALIPTHTPMYIERTKVAAAPDIIWPAYPTATGTPTAEAFPPTWTNPVMLQAKCIYQFGKSGEIVQIHVSSFQHDLRTNSTFLTMANVQWRFAESQQVNGQLVLGLSSKLDQQELNLGENNVVGLTDDGRQVFVRLNVDWNPIPIDVTCPQQ